MFLLDDSILTDLYLTYRSRLIGSLYRLTGCRTTASDLAQDAFLRLMMHPDLPTVANLPAYLFRIGHNLAIDFQRSPLGKAQFLALDESMPCPTLGPEEIAALREQCRLLLDTIFSMSPVCRDVFLLRKLDELSYAEISMQLGISEKTVQRRLVQAMLHCSRHLAAT